MRFIALLSVLFVAVAALAQAQAKADEGPPPPVVDPGAPGKPPADAVVLFSGKDTSAFVGPNGPLEGWVAKKGELVCTARHEHAEKTGTWDLQTKDSFGAIQLHVEFFVPVMKDAKGQARANSGIYLQGRYEVQILDSYENPTYPMGTLGAVYGHAAPLWNAARKPGQWQTYEIVFHPPVCNADGTTREPGSVTALLNNVLVQDHALIRPKNKCDDSPGPLRFQDHYHPDVVATPLKLRNVWLRKL
ncbi:MAG: DUF1080 domain-containing protein [Deltaproteobacteria bacterium]|nr:DUF1080 domain-containing protein [Deltaproteobacteria bacterium]